MSDFAIGEIESLVFKAYRGAGMSWGLAEEAGRAAGWLATHGLPGTDAFAGLVTELDETAYDAVAPQTDQAAWRARGGTLCPVVCGVTYCDLLPRDDVVLTNLSYPLIMTAFVAVAAVARHEPLGISWPGVDIVCTPDGIACASEAQALAISLAANVTVAPCGVPAKVTPADRRRSTIDPPARKILERFAHRTYVPASEESRLSGAGAGLTDND